MGVTMVVSKGEIVASSRKKTVVTFATIEIPARPSRANRDRHERQFLAWRSTEMRRRYQQTREKNRVQKKKGRR